jgi:hypothetical protein
MLAGLFGCVMCMGLAATPASAADDGTGDAAFEGNFLSQILESMGLQRSGTAIEYRERSPLVLPQSDALPPPQARVADGNPAWPVDQDLRRQREIKKASEARNREIGDSVMDDARVLRPSELRRGTLPRSRQTRNASPSAEDAAKPLSPSGLGYKGNLFGSLFGYKDEVGKFTGEPERTSLTEPPVGYQTPAPNQPYGVVKDRSYSKPTDYYTTHVEPTR